MVDLKKFLEKKAYNLRRLSIIMTSKAGSGHPTSCLSAADLVSVLFFYAMSYDPKSVIYPNNDRFILSKGHAAPLLYAAWQQVGVLEEQDLYNYRRIDSVLEGHPTARFAYSEAATGSLGIGLSIGVGQALSANLDNLSFRTYVLIGDSEVAEGSVWEAAELAAYYKLNNLIAILDCNRLGQSSETIHGHHVERYEKKFKAFGWETIVIDGHDIIEIIGAFDKAKKIKDMPIIIIAKTVKGYGIDSIANRLGYHGKALPKEELNTALKELEVKFCGPEKVGEIEKNSGLAEFDEIERNWTPKMPERPSEKYKNNICESLELETHAYKVGEKVSTRLAYGHALAKLGNDCNSVVCLDAEVKNSTYADIFEEKHKDRFFQCFIAEQNMVGMAIGFDNRGKMPFVSTFSCFMSRAHDQIRMAAIGQNKLKLVGSHAGVSIGQDGPSQMGLEDIALMRCLPESIVLYPCDGVSTYKLVEQMSRYDKGISYLRTTRMDTPVIYESYEDFPVGGCKVLKQAVIENIIGDKKLEDLKDISIKDINKDFWDKVCIIAAGVTVFEALKAYDILSREGISISVIDLYSIKPLDREKIIEVAKKSGNKIVTVEDHYVQGGLGEAVCSALANTGIIIEKLAVTKLPMSGLPEELLAWAGIDALAICKKVKSII